MHLFFKKYKKIVFHLIYIAIFCLWIFISFSFPRLKNMAIVGIGWILDRIFSPFLSILKRRFSEKTAVIIYLFFIFAIYIFIVFCIIL